jgi:prepilin-type N-terminal cleavage/methylation domain-containing protein
MRREVRGMSLIEVMIALSVVSVGMLALVSVMLACTNQTDADREDAIALGVARRQLQLLQAYCTKARFSSIFSLYGPNSTNAAENPATGAPDDVFAPTSINIYNGTVSAPPDGGNTVLVTSLDNINVPVISTSTTTYPFGTVSFLFPVDSTGAKLQDNPLPTATVPNPQVAFGLPAAGLDLTGRGLVPDAAGAGDHSADYKILPVIVRVQWQGTFSKIPRTLELRAILTQLYE